MAKGFAEVKEETAKRAGDTKQKLLPPGILAGSVPAQLTAWLHTTGMAYSSPTEMLAKK